MTLTAALSTTKATRIPLLAVLDFTLFINKEPVVQQLCAGFIPDVKYLSATITTLSVVEGLIERGVQICQLSTYNRYSIRNGNGDYID